MRYSITDYARLIGKSEKTVRRHLKSGKLSGVQEDGKYYVLVDEVAPKKTELPKSDKSEKPDKEDKPKKGFRKMTRDERKEYFLYSQMEDYVKSNNIAERSKILKNIIELEGYSKDSTGGGEMNDATQDALDEIQRKLKLSKKKKE